MSRPRLLDDEKRFAAAIAALGEAYRQKITPATVHAYDLGLNDLPIEAIESAVLKALRSCKFMPTPVELRELSGDLKASDRAVLAWQVFADAVVKVGAYRSVAFDDPVLTATVRNLGGWQYCCGLDPGEFDKWLRLSFLKAYEALNSAGIGPDASAPLPGIHAQHNAGLAVHPKQGPKAGELIAKSEDVVLIEVGYLHPQRKEIASKREPLKLTDKVGRMKPK